jgi:hypothetical protein
MILCLPLVRRDLDWQKYVKIDPWYFRPAEVDLLVGDATKARKLLNWEPKVKFKELVRLMVDADMAALKKSEQKGTLNGPTGVQPTPRAVRREPWSALQNLAQDLW